VGNTIDSSLDKLALCVGRPGSQQPAVKAASPRAGQYVRIDGRDEVFLILRVDKTRHLADLLRQGAVRKVQAGVPLSLLTVVDISATAGEDSSGSLGQAQFSEEQAS